MKRRLGQHFLVDPHSIARILDTAEITAGDRVVEIGPGRGSITFLLAERAGEFVAIEFDTELAARLQRAFAEVPGVCIVHADARHVRYASLFPADSESAARQASRLKIVANLPYYAAVPILLNLFRDAACIDSCTLMFQKEVAERITAGPGSKAYGLLSVTAQYYSTADYCFSLPAGAFRPPPKVMSAVVQLRMHARPRVAVDDEALFFQAARGAFQSRRKTLRNALTAYRPAVFPPALVDQALDHLGLDRAVRGEVLSLEQFAEFSNFCSRASG